jgi:hypothetical protein
VAALHDGNLSVDGIDRLADHVVGCESCKILVAVVMRDLLEVEATGQHEAASPASRRPK